MKKLTKEDLTELSRTLTLIEPNAQRQFIGGAGRDGDTLCISGGTLIDTPEGVDFISDSGETTHFSGVDLSTSWVTRTALIFTTLLMNTDIISNSETPITTTCVLC